LPELSVIGATSFDVELKFHIITLFLQCIVHCNSEHNLCEKKRNHSTQITKDLKCWPKSQCDKC